MCECVGGSGRVRAGWLVVKVAEYVSKRQSGHIPYKGEAFWSRAKSSQDFKK